MRITSRLSVALSAALALLACALAPAVAQAQFYPRSVDVALVPNDGAGGDGGIMPTTDTVGGRPDESFDKFTFSDLAIDAVTPAALQAYDTVVLNQVYTADLGDAARQALSAFVTGGGKLIIHDSDGTEGNDYSWLPTPATTGQACHNCGATDGTARVVENNTLVSANPADPAYVDVSELPGNTDAIGDANVMISQDDHWFKDIVATNTSGDSGAVHTYASDNGLIIFNGFDTDNMGGAEPSGVDWLTHMWYWELAQGWSPDGLPHGTPLNCSNVVGAVSPGAGTTPLWGKPGTTVTITGKSFCPGTRVRFGNAQATVAATVQNTGQMTAVVPRNATSAVTLVDPDGHAGAPFPFAVDSYRNDRLFGFSNSSYSGRVTEDDLRLVYGNNAFGTYAPCRGCAPVSQLTATAKSIFDSNQDLSGGLCFGMTVGSLRLGTGTDAVNSTSDRRRSAVEWNQTSVTALPDFHSAGDPYKTQMAHFLFAWQISQASSELVNPLNAYFKGVRSAADKGAYMLQAFQNAISGGPALVIMREHYVDPSRADEWHKLFGSFIGDGAPNAWDGHALVITDVVARPGGSFDVTVADPNKPWDSTTRQAVEGSGGGAYNEEAADGADHADALAWNTIHVDRSGSWTYDGNFGAPAGVDQATFLHWSGDPESLRPLAFSAISKRPLTPEANGVPDHAVVAGGPVGQITQSGGRSLYDANGQVRTDAGAADADVLPALNVATVGGPAPARPEPSVVLDRAGSYTLQTGKGAYTLAGAGLSGTATTPGSSTVSVAAGAGRMTVAPRAPGSVAITLTRLVAGQELTVGVAGRTTGAVTLTVGKTVSVASSRSSNLTVTVSRVGGSRTPRSFAATARLGTNEKLMLGSARRLVPKPRLRASVSRGHRKHSIVLVNRVPRPTARVSKAVYSRKTRELRISVVERGASGGRVIVAVRAGTLRRTVVVPARKSTVIASVPVGALRSTRVRIVALATSRRGQASTAARRTLRVR